MASAEKRSGIVRDALGIGIASGAYAISFGAISTTAGLSLLQTVALSLLMFTGASQFALVGVLGAGGSVWAGAGDCRAAGDSKCSLRCAAVIAAGSAWPSAGAGRAVRDRRDHRDAIARDTPP